MVVFMYEGTFGPTKGMLSMGNRINPLTWEVMSVYPTRLFSEIMSQNTFIFNHLLFFRWKDTLKLNMF